MRVLAVHLCGPGSNSGVEAICGSLLLVFSFAARGFYLGTPVFQFSICTSPTIHLVCLSPKFCITSVFQFSRVLQPSQEKLKTMLMQNFGGQIRCIMGEVQMANSNWTRILTLLSSSNSMTFHDLRFSCHFSSNTFKTLLFLAYFFSF